MIIDHKNSLVNLSNSLLNAFGVDTFHSTIKEFDTLFKRHKKIVVMLFDGLGKNIIEKHLDPNGFIRSHYFSTIYSTTPPTTAAATTAFLTGKFPIETGWLGWDTYFPEYNKNIVLFKGTDYNSGELIRKDNPRGIVETKFPTTSILELISKKSHIPTYDLKKFPICKDGPKSLRHGRKKLSKILHKDNECLVYFYWDNPDYTMHAKGIDSIFSHWAVKKVEKFVEQVVNDNPDTLFISIADHGHINTKYIDYSENDEFYKLLSKPCSLEKRCTSFFVKDGYRDEFEKLFTLNYSNEFDLLTKKEALKIKFFGEGNPAPGSLESIGDYIAISKGEYAFISKKDFKNPEYFKGHHAGGTKEEMQIDVSVYNR